MSRPVLSPDQISPAAQKIIEDFHSAIIREVSEAVQKEAVLVIGMAQNPFVKKARKALDEAGVNFRYLEYGSYFSMWRERLAIKLWSGWPTFPQVFVKGKLVGGFTDLQTLLKNGGLDRKG